jgi:hypothetical protein
MLLGVLLTIWSGVSQQRTPDPVRADAPAQVFSSQRALEDLRVIGRQPHPVGSQEHAAVRDYILNRLAALGLNPQLQTATAVNDTGAMPYRAGTVENVVARLKGAGNGGDGAIMLSAHYDSVPAGPGVSDDGAAVAAMLETARALKAGQPPKRDVIFLFTDGEEEGLLGASAFAADNPWMKDVALELNFEARGTFGPSIMFETSEQSGWLLDKFAAAAPDPAANSLSYEIYKRMPNNTDYTVFKKTGLPGLNFAYIGGFEKYHTALDNLDNLDERSLQHQGSYMLSLVRAFGDSEGKVKREASEVYFNIIGTFLIHYSTRLVLPLTLLAVGLYAALVLYGLRKRALTVGGLAMGFASVAVNLLLAWLLFVGALWLVAILTARAGRVFQPNSSENGLLVLGLAVLLFALTAATHLWWRKRAEVLSLAVGAMMPWALGALASALLVPWVNQVFVWPLLFATAAAFYALVYGTGRLSVAQLVVYLLSAIATLAVLVPLVYWLYLALELIVPLALALMFVLTCALLVPQLEIMVRPARHLLPVGAALLGLALLAAYFYTSFNRPVPRQVSLFYAMNADAGTAVWGSTDAVPSPWTSQFLTKAERGDISDYYPSRSRNFLKSPAPAVLLPSPRVEVLEDEKSGDVRRLRLRVTSARGAQGISIFIGPGAAVLAVEVNGKKVSGSPPAPVANADYNWAMHYMAPPPEGIELALEIKATQPAELVRVRVLDRSYGLPEDRALSVRPKTSDEISSPTAYNDSTLISKRFEF